MSRAHKPRRRLKEMATHALQGLLLPLFTALISLLVIRLASMAVWGAFVQVLVVVQFGTHIVHWGNKEYLLRAFSRRPGELAGSWQTAFFTRWLLYLGFVVVMAVAGWPLPWLLMICLWGAGLVVTQSFDVLVLYRRAFTFGLLVELGGGFVTLAGVVLLGSQLTVAGLMALFTVTQAGKASAFLLRWGCQISCVNGRFIKLATVPRKRWRDG